MPAKHWNWPSAFRAAFRRGSPINLLINDLIRKKVFPGLAVIAGHGDRVLREEYFGLRSLTPTREKLTRDTLFDTASLTKPLVTGLLAAILMDRGQIALEDPVSRFLPEFPDSATTIRHLVTHTSGFPDWHPLYLEQRPYLDTLIHMARKRRPVRRVEYSCLGFILLHFILERVTGSDLPEAARGWIFTPLGLRSSFLQVPGELRRECAPTEMGNDYEKALVRRRNPELLAPEFSWRSGMIRGETHDLNSHFLGGSAGNAGLFATPRDIFRLSAEFLPQTATLIRGDTLRLFTENLTPGCLAQRSFAFKLNSNPMTSAGRSLSGKAFGHNGFTGCSLWIDPRTGIRIAMLSNRVHPRVASPNFNRIRRRLHRSLLLELRSEDQP